MFIDSLSCAHSGRGVPHAAQNFPAFPAVLQFGQTQRPSFSKAGRGFPHSVQNLPVFSAKPQVQIHFVPGAAGLDGAAAFCTEIMVN